MPEDYRTQAAEPGTSVAVAATSTLVAPERRRAQLHLVNDSDTKMYVRLASPAAVGVGVPLYPNGGSFSFDDYHGALYAIHGGTGTKNLCVVEV